MSIQYINTGSSANAGNGDSLRSAFIKVNNNFAYLSTASFSGSGNGYTGSAGSQGSIGFTGSAGLGTVTSGNAGSFALYFSSGTVVSQNSILTLSTATVYVGQEFDSASFWLQREVYSNVFGQGFTYSQHHETSDAMNFSFYRTRGTAGAPTAVQNGDELAEIVFFGYNGSAVASGGGFTYHVDGNITSGRIPTKLSIATSNPSFSTPIVGAELSNSSTWKIFRLGHLSTTTSSITVSANLVPDQDSVRSLGSSLNQWRSLYVSSSTIYINRTPLTIDDQGTLLVNGSSVNGEGLGTITVPAVTAGTYKGLQVSYGMIHSNRDWDELNVNKIVIHKPVNPTVTIDPIANSDDFEVNGLGASDVLAMFVVYGDANGPKSLSTLRAFAEAAIDNIILTNGEEGVYNTVDQMKTAFYGSGQQLTAAADGLALNFEFFTYNTSFPVTGGGTLVEGSGATFNISDDGIGTYSVLGFASAPGNNYLPGHKIKILGTDLGGLTPDNDAIITITSIDGDGIITGASVTGTAAGASSVLYASVTGTNYQVGTGFSVSSLTYNIDTDTVGLGEWNGGSGYVTGDVIEILGTNILGPGGTPLVSPDNDITVTLVTDGFGIENFTVTGTLPTPVPAWPTNNISDGGEDQYDTGNYINTNLAEDIAYNGGETVVDGTTSFGTGSSYSFVYSTAIFGLFVTGNSATSLSTSGESGGDSSSTTEAGFIYDAALPEQTVDNAVNHINIVAPQNPYAGALVSFTHTDNGNEVDILIADDGLGAGVGITRNSNQGIYNPYRDDGWTSSVSPSGTLWNIDGWADFSDVESRTYTNLYAAFGNGGLGNNIVDTECVMYLPDNGKYYAVKFTQWTQNAGGGGFAYTRQEIDLDNIQYGIRFDDGTRLTSAEGLGRVKLRAPGNRRIEEVHGYKSVAVTQKVINLYTSTAYESNSGNTNQIRINAVGTALADLIALSGYYDIQVSLDQTNWVTGYIYGTSDNYVEVAFNNQARLPVVDINDTVYYRTRVGGEPVQWWSKSELPGGSTNFRGAVIDYHAYTTSGTVIGTIHIVDDDGEEHVTHTEVVSGSSDAEFIDLWFVTNEGSINFRRTDGIGSILRVQWTAKVFYGSQTYD